MDLSALDTSPLANEGAALHINGPTGQPLYQDDGVAPVTITLLGEDSDVVTKANNEAANRFLRSTMGASQQITAEVSKANEVKKFAAATVSWSGIVVEGETLACNAANAAAVYRRFPWIADQVRVFISDRANFLKALPKT